MKNVVHIVENFLPNSTIISIIELNSGHINRTIKIQTANLQYYILQQVNHLVFCDVEKLMQNKVQVSTYLQDKLLNLPEKEKRNRVLTFIPTTVGNYYHKEISTGNYYCLSYYIPNSITLENTSSEKVAAEAGKLYGEFLSSMDGFNIDQLYVTIPNFHNVRFRYDQFKKALVCSTKERQKIAKKYIDIVKQRRDEMLILDEMIESKKIPLRVTHNDTKISNILFDEEHNGLCVIDTDTVMPGVLAYDFGDAVRTICSTASEDEKELDKVSLNTIFYRQFSISFLKPLKGKLTDAELYSLPLGIKTIVYIMGMRFLTDYLNNDTYFKTNYDFHNLDRAANQFKLLEDVFLKYPLLKRIVDIKNSIY